MKLGKLLINALLIFMLLLKKCGVGVKGGCARVNGARRKVDSSVPGQSTPCCRGCAVLVPQSRVDGFHG